MIALCWLCWFRLVDKDTVRVGMRPNNFNANMTLLIQGLSYQLLGKYHPVPRYAEPIRFYRVAWNGMAMLIVTTCPWIP